MLLNPFQYVTPLQAAPNPNAAIATAASALGHSGDLMREDKRIKNQSEQFEREAQLRAGDQMLRADQQGFNQQKDRVELLGEYNAAIGQHTDEGDAKAQELAPTLKALGIDLQPVTPDHPDHQAAQPFEEWAKTQKQPETPPAAPKAEPKKVAAKPVPDQGELPSTEERAEAESRIADIGGEAQPVTQEAPVESPKVDTPAMGPSLMKGSLPVQVPRQEAPKAAPVPQAAAPEQPPAEPPQRPAYRVVINGQPMGVIDPNPGRQAAQEAAARRAEDAIAGTVPRYQHIMRGAFKGARTPQEAEQRLAQVMPEVIQLLKNEAAMAIASTRANAGPGLSTVNDDVEGILRTTNSSYKIPELHQRVDAADRAVALAHTDNPMAQRNALTANLKAMFSSVTSDRELGFAQAAAGKLTQLEIKFNEFFNGGALPENYLELMTDANAIVRDATDQALRRAGTLASNAVLKSSTIALDGPSRRQMAKVLYGRITGDFQDAPDLDTPGRTMGGGGGGKREGETRRGADPQTGKLPPSDMGKLPDGSTMSRPKFAQ